MICYALKEIASKRLEQAIDCGYNKVGESACKKEASDHFALADRICEASKQSA